MQLRTRPIFSVVTSSASSSRRTCFFIPVRDMPKGSASSLMLAAPAPSRSRTARRVGSARAAKARSTAVGYLTIRFSIANRGGGASSASLCGRAALDAIERRGRGGPRPHVELLEDVLDVLADGVRRDEEELRDLGVLLAVCDPAEDLRFAWRQAAVTVCAASEAGVAADPDEVRAQQGEERHVALGVVPAAALEVDRPHARPRRGEPHAQRIADAQRPPHECVELELLARARSDVIRQAEHALVASAPGTAERVLPAVLRERIDECLGRGGAVLSDDVDLLDDAEAVSHVRFLVADEHIRRHQAREPGQNGRGERFQAGVGRAVRDDVQQRCCIAFADRPHVSKDTTNFVFRSTAPSAAIRGVTWPRVISAIATVWVLVFLGWAAAPSARADAEVADGWAGYVVRADAVSFSQVHGRWTEPRVVCNRPGS